MVKKNSFLKGKINYPLSISLNMIFSPSHYSTYNVKCKGYNIDKAILYEMESINWFNLNKNGSIIVFPMTINVEKKPGIYVYKHILYKNKVYIGSSINVLKRLIDHNNSFNNNLKACPKFYNCVKKYGWNNFKVGVLEYLDLSKISTNVVSKANLKKCLLWYY